MTAEPHERKTVIHIDMGRESTTAQRSYSLKELQKICRLSNSSYFERTRGAYGYLWKADNHGANNYYPRFHHEHLEYLVAVVNGIMSEQEALDLWKLRKGMIRDELTNRALAPIVKQKRTRKTQT